MPLSGAGVFVWPPFAALPIGTSHYVARPPTRDSGCYAHGVGVFISVAVAPCRQAEDLERQAPGPPIGGHDTLTEGKREGGSPRAQPRRAEIVDTGWRLPYELEPQSVRRLAVHPSAIVMGCASATNFHCTPLCCDGSRSTSPEEGGWQAPSLHTPGSSAHSAHIGHLSPEAPGPSTDGQPGVFYLVSAARPARSSAILHKTAGEPPDQCVCILVGAQRAAPRDIPWFRERSRADGAGAQPRLY